MKLKALFIAFFLSGNWLAAGAFAASATLSINTASLGQTFIPLNAFGTNLAYWTGQSGLNSITPQMTALGSQFFRYPGGSSSDDYHWNGTGSFDGLGHWVPDDTNYGISWTGLETDRGTTSSYGTPSNLTDGDDSTRWLSNSDTDAPNAQWAYVDLGSAQSANAVSIDWSIPYATQFKVQYWNGAVGYPPPYGAASSQWTDTSAGLLTSTGGTQTISFSSVNSECFRVFCIASSVSPAQYSIAEIRVLQGATQLSVNVGTVTNNVPDQSWAAVSSTDVATSKQQVLDLDFETFMAWVRARSAVAKPLITINLGTGTPQEAAAWVHYANVVKGYGIKDWEIGNESEGNWETGGPLSSKDYARRYIEYYQAMKAVDPSIHIYGPVAGGPYDTSDDLDGKTRIQGFVDRLAADPGGNKAAYAEGIDYHWYPMYGTSATEAQSLASPSQLKQLAQTDLPAMLVNLPSAATVPVLMTEFNAGISCPLTVHLSSGLWLADSLGTMVSYFGPRASTHVWESVEGGDADTNLTGSSLGLLNGNTNTYLYQQRAQYWALQMLAQYWAIPGDASTHQLVSSTSNQGLLDAYADLRPDGVLSLLVVNKDPSNAYSSTLNFSGFSPNATASRWTFDASNYAWSTASSPYHASPDSAPTQGVESGISSGYSHVFGPYSITVLQFTNSTQPTNTVTVTPTVPTPTPIPTYGTHLLVDDFEDPSRTGSPPTRLDLMDGTWSTSQASSVTSTVSYLAPGAGGTTYSARWSLYVPSGQWANLIASVPVFNASGDGFVGLEFWALGDGHQYRAMVQTETVTDFDNYGVNFTPPTGVWTFYQIPFSSMTRQGWGAQSPTPPVHPAANDLVGVQFAIQDSGASEALELDQIGFYQAAGIATATSTQSASPTRSATPSFSITPTLTASLSMTNSYTISPTSTLSPSFSASPSASQTWTLSPSPSVTPTFSLSPTSSASPSCSPTLTASATLTPGPLATVAVSSNGPLQVLRALPQPNPYTGGDGGLAVLMACRADRFRVRLYSSAFRCLADLSLPGAGPGWCHLVLPASAMPSSNGLYFVELWAENGGQSSAMTRFRVYCAR